MTQDPITFFVAWRSPTTRAVLPVARIRRLPASGLYEFAYLRNAVAAEAQGFSPLLEFPTLGRVYRSPQPFPLLANRFLPPKRPEYAGFLQSLGLPATAHPMEILARAGGERQTDRIELFPMPSPTGDGCYRTHCLVRSVRHLPAPATEERVARLRAGEGLAPVPEPDNPHDPLAVRLVTGDGVAVGYLPAYLAADVRDLQARCGAVSVSVERVNPPPAEAHHRVLVRVDACWPTGFRPYAGPEFEPIVDPDGPESPSP